MGHELENKGKIRLLQGLLPVLELSCKYELLLVMHLNRMSLLGSRTTETPSSGPEMQFAPYYMKKLRPRNIPLRKSCTLSIRSRTSSQARRRIVWVHHKRPSASVEFLQGRAISSLGVYTWSRCFFRVGKVSPERSTKTYRISSGNTFIHTTVRIEARKESIWDIPITSNHTV